MKVFRHDRLKQLRQRARLTQVQLHNQINVSIKQISRWEQGKSEPDPEMLVELARFFKVTTDYLLGKSSDENLVHEGDLTPDERRFVVALRNEPTVAMEMLMERLREAFRNNPRLSKDE